MATSIRTCKKKNVLPAVGTPVRIKAKIDPQEKCGGFFVHKRHLDARKAKAKGVFHGWVPGGGGDLWWIKHPDDTIGAYMFTEVLDQ